MAAFKVNPEPEYFDVEFYPTPRAVGLKMLSRISRDAVNFLEPQAGAGDLAQLINDPDSDKWSSLRVSQRGRRLDVIEQSPELLAVLEKKGYTVVGFDWLEYSGVSYYDAIVMNPPFSNGATHLLKAWDFLYHGEIVCLLNAETIRNPCTEERKRLAAIIQANGDVEFLGDCFATATRKTAADVALVYLKKTASDDSFDLWSSDKVEKEHCDELQDDNLPAQLDKLGNLEHYYNLAIEEMLKGLKMIRRAKVYMDALGVNKANVRTEGDSYTEILAMGFGKDHNTARAEFIRKLRRDAWFSVLQDTKFKKWLDKKQTDEFLRDVEKSGNIPFTADNVKNTLENVFLQRGKLFEKSCANVFDELTRYYNGNTNYREGWKTNDNFIVNQKIVFPYGCSFSFNHFGTRDEMTISIYNDIDRCLSVLAGRDFDEVLTIGKALDKEFQRLGYNPRGPFKAIESEYFEIRYFKKGTIHLKFKDRELWGRFNQKAAAGKKWVGSNTKTS